MKGSGRFGGDVKPVNVGVTEERIIEEANGWERRAELGNDVP